MAGRRRASRSANGRDEISGRSGGAWLHDAKYFIMI